MLAKGITIRAHKPTNSLFLRHYAADLERIKGLIRENLDIPLPQVKIEARMEILARNALEPSASSGAAAGPATGGQATLVGQRLTSRSATRWAAAASRPVRLVQPCRTRT